MAEIPTRTRYAVLLFVYLAAFITYLDRVCLSVAAPAMQAELRISQVEFGWVFAVFYIAYALFEMPTAWLGDRWGQRRILVRIVGCWSIFTILTGLASSFTTMLVTRFVFGAAEAGAFPKPSETVPWRTLLLNRTMLALFCSYCASGFGFQFFVTWLPTYFMREHGLSLQKSGVFAALPLAAGAVGCVMGGVIADFITRRTGSVVLGRRSVGVSGFLLGAAGDTAAFQVQS